MTDPVTPAQIRAVRDLQGSLPPDYCLQVNPNWAILSREPRDSDPEALDQLGRMGLWKTITHGRCPQCVAEIPLSIVDQIGTEESEDDEATGGKGARFCGLKRFIDWGISADTGRVPDGWNPPAADQVISWIGTERLSVQCDDIAIQGRVIRSEGRLAVTFPILTSIGEGLSPARRQKLTMLLLDAQRNWRMTRVGLGRSGLDRPAFSASAELDLSGAPPAAIEPLLHVAVDSLHQVVRWCAAPAALIVDPNRACELLDH